jgi:hypothetical protein
MLAAKQSESAVRIAQKNWPDDQACEYILRAATSPTSTATSQILPTLVGPFLRALTPQSAATRLFERAIRLDFQGVYQYVVPYPSVVPVPIFIGEGAPFPMVQSTLTNSTVGATKKILIGSAVTSELEAASAESAATIIGNILADSASRSLDKYVFDNVAADATRPAGLLNGVYTRHSLTHSSRASRLTIACRHCSESVIEKWQSGSSTCCTSGSNRQNSQ